MLEFLTWWKILKYSPGFGSHHLICIEKLLFNYILMFEKLSMQFLLCQTFEANNHRMEHKHGMKILLIISICFKISRRIMNMVHKEYISAI